MKGMRIMPNGERRIYQRWKFDLKFLQEIVGGNIELLSTFDGKDMVVNEDAMSLKLPPNLWATAYLHPDYKEGSENPVAVLGTVFIFLKGKLK